MKRQFEFRSEKAVIVAVCFALAVLPGRITAQTTPDAGPSAPPPSISGDAPAGAQIDAGTKLSTPVHEVLKMSAAGVAPQVIMAYVNNAPAPFHLTSDNIIHLHGVGVSGDVLAAMLNRDVALHDQALLAARGLAEQSAMAGAPQPGTTPYYPYNQQAYPPNPQAGTDYGALPPGTSGYDYGDYPYYPYN